jgi:hypothetical protein
MRDYSVLLHVPIDIEPSTDESLPHLTFLAWVTATSQNDAIRMAQRECARGYDYPAERFKVIAMFQGFHTDVSCNTST